MKGYGQFCPVAKAAEVLGERWTPLVIRELTCGSASFNDIRRGVPLMSPSLLSARLRVLERLGVVERIQEGRGIVYSLTRAGEELRPIIEQLGVWGQRWARTDMTREDLDPSLLMWDVHRRIDVSYFRQERTVILFEFTDYLSKMRCWWLVVKQGEVDICLKDPGYDIDLHVQVELKSLIQIWMGDISLAEARRKKLIHVSGAADLDRSMSRWLLRSQFATVERPAWSQVRVVDSDADSCPRLAAQEPWSVPGFPLET